MMTGEDNAERAMKELEQQCLSGERRKEPINH
jgi:hypothetical protein